jgi:hypothetical protein
MCDTNVLSFQVEQRFVRAISNSGLYIDIMEIKYCPEPTDLGNKMRYRIFYAFQGNENGFISVEFFSNDDDAIHSTFSDEVISKAKQQLKQMNENGKF